jgi:hypothetical protein
MPGAAEASTPGGLTLGYNDSAFSCAISHEFSRNALRRVDLVEIADLISDPAANS